MTEVPTAGGKLYLATVIDLYSRRLLGAATGLHPDADLACQAIRMAVAVRGGKVAIWRDQVDQRVIFHTDRGSTYTATTFAKLCADQGLRQSMGRVGRASTTPPPNAFFSSLEWEVLSRNTFDSTRQAQAVIPDWAYGFYNHQRRHSTIGMIPPVQYNKTKPTAPAARHDEPSTIWGSSIGEQLSGRRLPGPLLIIGAICATNILIFALWYRELDRGSPAARAATANTSLDWIFPQMATPNIADPGHDDATAAPSIMDALWLPWTIGRGRGPSIPSGSIVDRFLT